ncbi:LamG domain-containing protein, partial [Thermoproteota archaeon]
VHARLRIPSGTYTVIINTSAVINFNEWHHISVTQDGSQVRLYVDGIEETISGTNSGDWWDDIVGENAARIASSDFPETDHDTYFNGTIDEVRIYNRSLSPDQILALYNNRTDLIVSNETSIDDIWQACVTPNDGIEDGTTNCSDNLTVLAPPPAQAPPVVENVTLNSTSSSNLTGDNLTVYYDASDINDDSIYNITDWRLEGTSIAVLNMPFENHSLANETAVDYSTSGNNGTLGNGTAGTEPTFTSSGYLGGAYEFDGVDDYIEVGYTTQFLPVSDDFSMSVWVKSTDGLQTIIGKRYSGGEFWRLYKNDFEAFNGISLIDNLNSSVDFYDGDWHFITVVVDRDSAANTKFYVDGVDVTDVTPSVSTDDLETSNARVAIGALTNEFGATTGFFNGTIDEMRVWNRILSQAQVVALYNNRTDLIVSQETSVGDVWQACITPNDGVEDGNTSCSDNLTILNAVPQVDSISLNATSADNITDDNLTLHTSLSDADGISIINIADWRVDGTSIAVLNMPFEVDEDQNATDYSIFGNDGNNNGATWISNGHIGGAYDFNGSGAYVDCGNDTSLGITGDISIEVWIRPDVLNSNVGIAGIQETPSQEGYLVAGTAGNRLRFGLDSGSVLSASTIAVSKWTHVVGVYDGSDIMIYINGTLDNSTGYSSGSTPHLASSSFVIGRWYGNYDGYYFNGDIDGVRVYNRSLSPEQIKALYNDRTDLIVSNETSIGDNWSACVTPNDGIEDGTENCSNNLTILSGAPAQAPPYVENVTLNSTSGNDLTSDNLTVYYDTYDINDDPINASINWVKNGRSYLPKLENVDYSDVVLKFPFENYTAGSEDEDISIYSNDGVVTNAQWQSAAGHDGYGAYYFDGTGDYLTISDSASLDISSAILHPINRSINRIIVY